MKNYKPEVVRDVFKTDDQGFSYYKSVMSCVLRQGMKQRHSVPDFELASMVLCMTCHHAHIMDLSLREWLNVNREDGMDCMFNQHFIPLTILDRAFKTLMDLDVVQFVDRRDEYVDTGSDSLVLATMGMAIDHDHKRVGLFLNPFGRHKSPLEVRRISLPPLSEVN